MKTFPVQVKKIGDQYMKLLIIHIFLMKLFPTEFLDHCKKNGNKPQNIPSEVKTVIKNCFETRIACICGYNMQKGVRLYKRKIYDKIYITSKDNQQEQNIGLILIMSG